MDQRALNHSLESDGTCAELLSMAQRELAAFFRAVAELFGPQQAELAADDWLHEVTASSSLPASAREWRLITARVIAQLADRFSNPPAILASAQLQPASH